LLPLSLLCPFCSLSLYPLRSPLFPYTTLFRSFACAVTAGGSAAYSAFFALNMHLHLFVLRPDARPRLSPLFPAERNRTFGSGDRDRKSTRLNSSHVKITYAVFCLKKKNHHKTH